MSGRQWASNARYVTLAVAGVLGGLAAVIGWQAGSGPIVVLDLPDTAILAGLVALFFLAEYSLLNVEFRREAHSLTLAGVPVMLAVLLAPAHTAVLARVLGALAALLLQRIDWDKVVFNTASYAFEIAVSSALARLLIGSDDHLGADTFAIVLVVVVAVDQLMSGVVLWIIRLHGGHLGRRQIVRVLTTSVAMSVMTSSFAAAIVVLINRAGALGIELVVLVTVITSVAYRGYASTRRRHQSLELMHNFVADGVGAESVNALTEQLLRRIRTLMNAGSAELRIFAPEATPRALDGRPEAGVRPADVAVRMLVTDDPGLHTTQEVVDPADWLTLRVRTENEPALLARDAKDRGIRAWLKSRDLRDAVIVPLPANQGTAGLVLVGDRLGETTTFTDDDVSLLQTLTGHLAVALRSTQLVEKLSYDASHDSLTGLYNRSYLTSCIQDTHAGRVTRDAGVAILLLDLDGFKEVNDTLGHAVGDRLLQIVGKRLVSHTPTGAIVARLGGDEFAVLVRDLTGGQDQALAIAQQIADSLLQPFHLDEARLDVQVSIGVTFSTGLDPADDLLRQADTAMYTAKTARQPISLYNAEMDRIRTERLELLTDLRAALRTDPDQFLLHYQPKIDLKTEALIGVEALVRWQHPRLGFIGPDLFIPLAEATGLVDELTPLVLDQALAECAIWTARGHRASVAVNFSARNIENPRLPHMVADALSTHRVDPALLVVEITESSVMGDPKQTTPVLHQLNNLGLSLSLDDFGTGHSSLAYLQQLPVTEVKIDRSFVIGLDAADPTNSRALVRSIAGLSKNLGLRVVAEGVENEERLAELRELGCDIAQGYHISRPLAAPELHDWMSRWAATHSTRRLRLLEAIEVDRPAVGLRPGPGLHRSSRPAPKLHTPLRSYTGLGPFRMTSNLIGARCGSVSDVQ